MGDKNLEFVSSLSSAIVEKHSRSSRIMLNTIFVVFMLLIVWASFAQIDEITRGDGKVVPSSKVKIVQNLEGGIVSEILVKNSQMVKKGTPLLKIENKQYESSYIQSGLKLDELKIRAKRLECEAKGCENYEIKDEQLLSENKKLIENETILFNSHMRYLQNQIDMVKEQIKQNDSMVQDFTKILSRLKNKQKLLKEEIGLITPLVKKGIESRIELIRLEKDNEGISSEIETKTLELVKAKSVKTELLQKIDDLKISFSNRAQQELNEVISEISQILNEKSKFKDQVTRTLVTSPVNGKVKRLLINTIGGVVKPGEDLVEIVPIEDELIVEARIKPKDIAFLYPDQKAIIKFTAYDFSIHGGLEAKLTGISADTIEDEKGNSFYLVELKTTNKFFDDEQNSMKIIPGMTVTVDILTGKKTIMEYILKPIFKAKDNALSER
ncbi:MAG: HlyD family type I secretion periplasmic adaptor subunit [Campylobacterales bacterium]|nr:HlyD family type I secretion periplasmic adaptor subunit [Campylobacterales bacterium]